MVSNNELESAIDSFSDSSLTPEKIGEGIYSILKEKGLNLIQPRKACDSLNPCAPRTLIDLLGESGDRARRLQERIASGEAVPGAEDELTYIQDVWESLGYEAEATGDTEIAEFISNFSKQTFQ